MFDRSLAARLGVRDILGPGGLAARILPRWEPRESQLEMAEAVLERLLVGGTLAVEAPTGVGKTLAYLVPAALSGRRVIVSTHTKTLQDQIIDKDLPLLERILGAAGIGLVRSSAEAPGPAEPHEVRYALMKGRANYLCLDRLDRKTQQRSFDFDHDLFDELVAWAATTERGDRAELVGLPERSPLWDELDARSEICHGSRCPRYAECFVGRMRKEAQNASLIVVNHHLLLADLALKAEASLSGDGRSFGEVIPQADALILDEAHVLEETASDYFGGQISTRKVERYGRDLGTYLSESQARTDRTALSLELTTAMVNTEAVFVALPWLEGRARIAGSRDPGSEGQDTFTAARRAAPASVAAWEGLAARLDLDVTEDAAAEGLARRARDIAESLRFVLAAEDPDFVYWAERQGKVASLGAAPINVAGLLGSYLFEAFGAVALTSATLSTGDAGLGYYRRAVGAPEDAGELVLTSPFDFRRQAALYLPEDAPEPNSPGAILDYVRIGKALIELMQGGALFLFTSYRVMRAVHAQLGPQLPYPVLLQGERPKRELLRSFVERAPAVLFATASFWEGVDIPGDPLRLVLIDRLPFDAPNDPLVQARSERLEAEGKSAFNSLHLPRAILRLKQGFGRLVRGREDRGVVAILDRRVQTKPYGKRFLRALPEARRIVRLEDLEAWLREEGPEVS